MVVDNLTARDLPSWFSLEKYDRSSELTPREWYLQAKIRRMVLFAFPDYLESEGVQAYIDLIQQSGIVDEAEISDLYTFHSSFLRDYLDDPSIRLIRCCEVTGMAAILDGSDDILDGEMLNPDFGEQITESKITYDDYVKDSFVDEGIVHAEINLNNADETLIEDYKRWLSLMRKQQRTEHYRMRNFSESDFKRWSRLNVLAYVDLVFWGALQGRKFSNHVMGQILFPDEFDVDLGERVRKTVALAARELFDLRSIKILAGMAE